MVGPVIASLEKSQALMKYGQTLCSSKAGPTIFFFFFRAYYFHVLDDEIKTK